MLDSSGCLPYTKDWFFYWGQQAERLLAGEDVAKPPIAFFNALCRDSDRRREAARTLANRKAMGATRPQRIETNEIGMAQSGKIRKVARG